MARRLSRRSKDLVCMRQLATCVYCGCDLCDAFEVDHVNERRTDDREENLVATCAQCHAIKSRHVRLGRDWSTMSSSIVQNRQKARDRWYGGADYDALPRWLRARVSYTDARLYSLLLRPSLGGPLDLEQYRYRPAHPPHPHSGSRHV